MDHVLEIGQLTVQDVTLDSGGFRVLNDIVDQMSPLISI